MTGRDRLAGAISLKEATTEDLLVAGGHSYRPCTILDGDMHTQ